MRQLIGLPRLNGYTIQGSPRLSILELLDLGLSRERNSKTIRFAGWQKDSELKLCSKGRSYSAATFPAKPFPQTDDAQTSQYRHTDTTLFGFMQFLENPNLRLPGHAVSVRVMSRTAVQKA